MPQAHAQKLTLNNTPRHAYYYLQPARHSLSLIAIFFLNMVVTRSGTKEAADHKKEGKANETMGVTMETRTKTKETHDKERKYGIIPSKQRDAFSMFMITDFLKRFYQNHPRSTSGLIPDDAAISGNIEWTNMSKSEKASWIEKVNNMKAAGKTLFQLRSEYYYLY